MHSFPTKAALAALFVATALAGANAASMGQSGAAANGATGVCASGSGRSDVSRDAFGRGSAMNHNRADDPNDMLSPGNDDQGYYSAPTMQYQTATPHYSKAHSQRLSHIVNELGAADHRITMDRQHGRLTTSQAESLRNQARSIRNSAYATAGRHGGRLPSGSYERLQGEIHTLNRSIHRDAQA